MFGINVNNNDELSGIISKTKDLRVLFVEKDKVVRKSALKIFNQFFNDIVIVSNGKKGSEEFLESRKPENRYFDIIISDIDMPKLSGIELAKKIRSINYSVPILFFVFPDEIHNFIDIIDLRVNGFLSKPLNFDKFIFYIKRILEVNEARNIQNYKQRNILDTIDQNVIFTKTDLKGIITHASEAFCEISGYTKDELVGQPHNIVRHPDMPMETFMYIWSIIPSGEVWSGDIKNLKKDGSHYWVHATITPEYDYEENHIGYISVRKDIELQKEVEILNASLEMKIEDRTKKMEIAKKEAELIMKSILIPVLITSVNSRKILYANKYASHQYEMPLDKIIGMDMDDLYSTEGQNVHLIHQMKTQGYIDNVEETFQTHTGRFFTALLSVVPIRYNNEDCYIGMVTDITKQKDAEAEVRAIQKHTRESIEYASLIQGALIPEDVLFQQYFKDYFVMWHPKDIVGGDIYLFEELRHNDECLLMFIDCTGHGVPGAFVTMLVKAVERQVIAEIMNDELMDVSPSWIMAYFNRNIKKLLKQETADSVSNAGWDGGIIYYNKKTQILKFAGAETPLFYIDENKEFKTIKGNRYSVGYKKCDPNYKYKETIIEVKEGMKFYCTTDGYLDQNGGEKDFPFGKKRFGNIIQTHHNDIMSEQKEIFIKEMFEYESMIKNNDRNDDMTVIAFEIQKALETPDIILEYEGILTQGIITHSIDVIESNIENMGMTGKISTLAIELLQNMMNYSKSHDLNCKDIKPAGFIKITKDKDDIYSVQSRNIVSLEDKEKIEPKLIEIQSLDASGIKKRYRELRKSGENTHDKGGGIGFYEIAKLTTSIEYKFRIINEEKYNFEFKAIVQSRRKNS